MDKAGKRYWDESWAGRDLPAPVDPYRVGLDNYVNRRFHQYFCKVFGGLETRGKGLLEIGCARSVWLPYFAEEFGFKVAGIDYSEIGCQQTRRILTDRDIAGEIVCADFFAPPPSLLERFDVVFSSGVAEHFLDLRACISAFAKFLKPGGLLVTIVPNLRGVLGWVQKTINRPVYDIHVILDKGLLTRAHTLSGLDVLDCDYFIFTSFGICNLNGLPPHSPGWALKKLILTILSRVSKVLWYVEGKVGPLALNQTTASYINTLSRKPGGQMV